MADTYPIELEIDAAEAAPADVVAQADGVGVAAPARVPVQPAPVGSVGGAAVSTMPRESGVLVVEDDPDTQWRLARMLTVHGARVVGTSSGEAALALIEQWPADLVLVDQGLPGISGLEVARRIQQQHPGIPVVLMSTEESTDLRLAAKVAGAVLMLIKPFRVEIVFEMLQRIREAGAKLVAVDGEPAVPFDPDLAPAE